MWPSKVEHFEKRGEEASCLRLGGCREGAAYEMWPEGKILGRFEPGATFFGQLAAPGNRLYITPAPLLSSLQCEFTHPLCLNVTFCTLCTSVLGWQLNFALQGTVVCDVQDMCSTLLYNAVQCGCKVKYTVVYNIL